MLFAFRSHRRKYNRSRSRSERRYSRSRSRGHRSDRRERDRYERSYRDRDRNRERERDKERERDRERARDREKDRNRDKRDGDRRDRERERNHRKDREKESKRERRSSRHEEEQEPTECEDQTKCHIESRDIHTSNVKIDDDNNSQTQGLDSSAICEGYKVNNGSNDNDLTENGKDYHETRNGNSINTDSLSRPTVLGVKLAGPEDLDYLSPSHFGSKIANGSSCGSDSSIEVMDTEV